jgi:methanogenic corrinoid protein MtbC1
MSVLSKISSCVIEGNLNDIQALTNQALEEGISAKEILDQGLMPGMDHVGVEF